MLILPRPRFTQPQQPWPVAREYQAHLAGLMLPSLGLTAQTGQAITRVGTTGFIGGSLHEVAYRHTDIASFYRAPLVNNWPTASDGPSFACLGRFRMRQTAGADRQAIFGLGADTGGPGTTLFITAVDASDNISCLIGNTGTNPGWDNLGVKSSDFQWHTVLMEACTSPSGFTFSWRITIDGRQVVRTSLGGAGGAMPFNWLCALGTRRTTDISGELHADVSLVAGWIFPRIGAFFFTEDQASRLTRNPYAELFAPTQRRVWIAASGPANDTTLAASGNASVTGAANLTTAIRLAATPSATVVGSANLTTAIRLAATPSASVTGTAALTTAIRLAAAPSASVTGAANLTTAIRLAAAGTVSVTGTAALTTGDTLAASGTASVTGTANLTTAIRLAATPTVSVTGSANLQTSPTGLEAQATASVTGTAALTTAIRLAATPSASVSGAANLTTAIRLAANPAVSVTGTADLQTGAGTLAASGTVTFTAVGALLTQIRLQALASVGVTGTANLDTNPLVAGIGDTYMLLAADDRRMLVPLDDTKSLVGLDDGGMDVSPTINP